MIVNMEYSIEESIFNDMFTQISIIIEDVVIEKEKQSTRFSVIENLINKYNSIFEQLQEIEI